MWRGRVEVRKRAASSTVGSLHGNKPATDFHGHGLGAMSPNAIPVHVQRFGALPMLVASLEIKGRCAYAGWLEQGASRSGVCTPAREYCLIWQCSRERESFLIRRARRAPRAARDSSLALKQ